MSLYQEAVKVTGGAWEQTPKPLLPLFKRLRAMVAYQPASDRESVLPVLFRKNICVIEFIWIIYMT